MNTLPAERAALMGMPHMGAAYTGSNDRHRVDDGAVCPFCGSFATEAHHMVPKGIGGGNRVANLYSEWGVFVLRSPLFALCRRHHEWFHKGYLKIEWVWDDAEAEEKWKSGYLLSHEVAPHSEKLFEYGHYRVTSSLTESTVDFNG